MNWLLFIVAPVHYLFGQKNYKYVQKQTEK